MPRAQIAYITHLKSKHERYRVLCQAAARGQQVDFEPAYTSLVTLEQELQTNVREAECGELLFRGDDGNLHLVFWLHGIYAHIALDRTHNPDTGKHDRGLVLAYNCYSTLMGAMQGMSDMVVQDRN